MDILILNGPNLNLLGKREPEIYGNVTFEEHLTSLRIRFPEVTLHYFQSNHEGELVDRIHQSLNESIGGMIINLGAFTHYSYALYDALRMIPIPAIEVHISHIYQREAFRHTSVTAPACQGLITGLGIEGYSLAIQWFYNHLGENT
ncbi:MAG: type II 3-dehydroquinate dehydratase [Bacteroidota bacterium]